MKVLVCGGRDFADYDRVAATLDALRPAPTLIIHGGARGADTLAERWATERGVDSEVYYAEWKTHRKKAGILRNIQMLKEGQPDLVVAFPGGKGTADMVKRAVDAGVEVWQE